MVFKKFPFHADEFKYPHDGKTKPQSLYVKASSDYGSKKPNELELPGIVLYNNHYREVLPNQ